MLLNRKTMMKKYNTDSTMDEKDVKDHKWNLFKLFADTEWY